MRCHAAWQSTTSGRFVTPQIGPFGGVEELRHAHRLQGFADAFLSELAADARLLGLGALSLPGTDE